MLKRSNMAPFSYPWRDRQQGLGQQHGMLMRTQAQQSIFSRYTMVCDQRVVQSMPSSPCYQRGLHAKNAMRLLAHSTFHTTTTQYIAT
jgi:hypothetical protein